MTTIYTPKLETIMIDALADICSIVVAPLELMGAILGALAAVLGLLWRNRKRITLGALVVGFTALCVAYPLLPLGLAITAAVGWATYPRRKVVSK